MPDEKLTYGHPDSAVMMPEEANNAKEIQILNQKTYSDGYNFFSTEAGKQIWEQYDQ